ncbi:glucan biosynthesis protein [Sediminicurvatus halobius]|uniref:Glucans biosynthesis protein D n=1 Tax=Sediminicurvatus halobius TaxID=2182432 RepID=A0A2U2N1Q5_9GAMM|nr:glucan biosynthesis protein [Spiribacter halobius]PWG62988.1 glucan biosynthesis protein D [Spiribacter halobius]UEX77505.1 glucan biosynthesis protein [Spiribacter halobius]
MPDAGIDRDRRRLLQAIAALAASPWAALLPAVGAAATPSALGPAQPFTFEALRRRARDLAARPYQAAPAPHSDLLDAIDYDASQRIRYRPEATLWRDKPSAPPLQLFHPGRHAQRPVGIHLVSDGQARRVRFDPALFDYGATGIGERLPEGVGFAGFRALHRDRPGDWLAFQGASYFRAAGPLDQYGLSARGIAVDTATPGRNEEFPRFTDLWLEPGQNEGHALTVHALLDGPSLAGAYRFHCSGPGATRMDVRAELFPRREITGLGIAPLTSMFWYGETHGGPDWRPEIHDSDGLALWTGSGERLWRPLNNPPRLQTSAFRDRNPRGFGLMQRDRVFSHYQDDGVFYDRRPSAWVAPRGDWGEGVVELVEIPTDDEIYDNIVCYWRPAEPIPAGGHRRYDYHLHWVAEHPDPPEAVGRARATRSGRAGRPGQPETYHPNGVKYVVDFEGGPLAGLEQRFDVEMVVTASRGEVRRPYALKVVDTPYWRGAFDLIAEGAEPVELRAFLRLDGRALTETWAYQHWPAR